MSNKAHDDVIIEAVVKRVLAPYLAILPPNKLEDFRRSLRFGLSTHPDAQAILAQLRPRAEKKWSGQRSIEGGAAEVSDEKSGTGGGK
jgi:hypothetical protein